MLKFKFKFECIALKDIPDMGIRCAEKYSGKGHIDNTGVVNYIIRVGVIDRVTCNDDWFYKHFRMVRIGKETA